MRNRNEISVLVKCLSGFTQVKNGFGVLGCLSFLLQLFLEQNNKNRKGCEYWLAHILCFWGSNWIEQCSDELSV